MDVNWAGWSVKNSTTDMWDLAWWDFAAIWAWIWAGFWTWALVGSWTWPWAIVSGAVGAIVWWWVATVWMMYNHWDNYFNSEDYWKGLTELWINTVMFWAGWWAYKLAKWIQWTSSILSKQGLIAIWTEVTLDVHIWFASDYVRAFAYNLDIEINDAIKNNLVWALLPIALPIAMRWKDFFSAARQKLANDTTQFQQKVSILSKLWDKTWVKKLIDGFNSKVEKLRNKEWKVAKEKTSISESINKDLENLKKWESIEYPNGLKIIKTNEWEYKVWETTYSNLTDATKSIETIVSNNFYELILKWWHKEFTQIRQKLIKNWTEFWEWTNIFKLNKEWELLKKGNDWWFKKIEISKLTSEEQNILSKTILWEKWYRWFSNSFDKLSNSSKKLWEMFNWSFWEKLKGNHPKKIKLIEWIYNQSIWSYINEMIKSWKADWWKKISIGRTFFTWKHSDELYWSKYLLPTAWIPSKWNIAIIGTLWTAEYLTWNFSEDDLKWNYFEVIMLWWLWMLILETPTIIETWKTYMWVGLDAVESMERN